MYRVFSCGPLLPTNGWSAMTIPDAPNFCSACKGYLAELFHVDGFDDVLKFNPMRIGGSKFGRLSTQELIV